MSLKRRIVKRLMPLMVAGAALAASFTGANYSAQSLEAAVQGSPVGSPSLQGDLQCKPGQVRVYLDGNQYCRKSQTTNTLETAVQQAPSTGQGVSVTPITCPEGLLPARTNTSCYNPANLLIVAPLVLLFTAAVVGASTYLYYEARRQIRMMNEWQDKARPGMIADMAEPLTDLALREGAVLKMGRNRDYYRFTIDSRAVDIDFRSASGTAYTLRRIVDGAYVPVSPTKKFPDKEQFATVWILDDRVYKGATNDPIIRDQLERTKKIPCQEALTTLLDWLKHPDKYEAVERKYVGK